MTNLDDIKVVDDVEISAHPQKISAELGMDRVGVDDVAREAGVSVATVSRVVNNSSPYIAETTRKRVEQAIRTLHYTPNRLVRSLQEGCTKVIAYACLYPGLFRKDEAVMSVLASVFSSARNAGYDVMVLNGSLKEDGAPIAASILDGRCDGVLLESPANAPVVDALIARHFPAVIFGNRNRRDGIGSVRIDNESGVRQAVQHLLGLGHRKIAHFVGPMDGWDEAICRYEAFSGALTDAGIKPDPRYILPDGGMPSWDADPAMVESVLDEWSSLPDPPTAVFCVSDRLAVALIDAAGRRGLSVPEDLSVIGFDDIPMARYISPSLTTITWDMDEMSEAAVDMLDRLIRHRKMDGAKSHGKYASAVNDESKVLQTRLVIRESTAAPRD